MHTDEWQVVEDITIRSAPGSPVPVVRASVAQQPQPLLHQYHMHEAVIDHIVAQAPEPAPMQPLVEPEPHFQEAVQQPVPIAPIVAPPPAPAPSRSIHGNPPVPDNAKKWSIAQNMFFK